MDGPKVTSTTEGNQPDLVRAGLTPAHNVALHQRLVLSHVPDSSTDGDRYLCGDHQPPAGPHTASNSERASCFPLSPQLEWRRRRSRQLSAYTHIRKIQGGAHSSTPFHPAIQYLVLEQKWAFLLTILQKDILAVAGIRPVPNCRPKQSRITQLSKGRLTASQAGDVSSILITRSIS